MLEVVVDASEIGLVTQVLEELGSHSHQGRGAVRRLIQAAKQLLSWRLYHTPELGQCVGRAVDCVASGGDGDHLGVRIELGRQCLEELQCVFRREDGEAIEDDCRERHSRSLTPGRDQCPAQIDERAVFDGLGVAQWVALSEAGPKPGQQRFTIQQIPHPS